MNKERHHRRKQITVARPFYFRPWNQPAPEPWISPAPEPWISPAPEPWTSPAPEPWTSPAPEPWTSPAPEPWTSPAHKPWNSFFPQIRTSVTEIAPWLNPNQHPSTLSPFQHRIVHCPNDPQNSPAPGQFLSQIRSPITEIPPWLGQNEHPLTTPPFQHRSVVYCPSEAPSDHVLRDLTNNWIENHTNSTIASPNISLETPVCISGTETKSISNRQSACYSSAPTTKRDIEISEDGGMRIHVRNATTEAETADVIYLYSVDSNKGKLVELVDLTENSQSSEDQHFIPSGTRAQFAKASSNTAASIEDSLTAFLEKEKGKSCQGPSKKQGEMTGEACCTLCCKEQENLRCSGYELYSSKCGHLYCVSCLKKLKSNKCVECNKAISNLWKIVL